MNIGRRRELYIYIPTHTCVYIHRFDCSSCHRPSISNDDNQPISQTIIDTCSAKTISNYRIPTTLRRRTRNKRMPSESKKRSSSSTSGPVVDWSKSIRSVLQSSEVVEVKKLRKNVLLSLQLDESDKAAKKQFKHTIQQLEQEGILSLDANGTIKLAVKEKKKRKREKEENKSKKKKKKTTEVGDHDEEAAKSKDDDENEDNAEGGGEEDQAPSTVTKGGADSKNKPVKGNPQGVTRLFVGNLPFTVDEASLGAFLPGEVTHIKWITDKETGKFYGSAFVEMDNSVSAAEAVAMAGEKLIGRPVKINFAPARDDDVWPPVKKVVSGGGVGGGGGQAGGKGVKAMSAKPDGCVKLFIGNLSYDIDDEGITKFFANVDAEVKTVRWLHHQDTGDFKGV